MRVVTKQRFKSFVLVVLFFFFNDTATTEIYTLSLHDALPISARTSKYALRLGSCGFTIARPRGPSTGQTAERLLPHKWPPP